MMLASSVQAAVVALIVFAILKIAQRRISSQLNYALLLVVLIKFATPPFFYLSTGFFSQTAVAQLSVTGFLDRDTSAFANEANVANQNLLSTRTLNGNDLEHTKAEQSKIEHASDLALAGPFPWRLGLFCVYGLGVLFFAFRRAGEFYRLRKVVTNSELQFKGDLYTELAAVASRVGLRMVPELRLSDNANAPFVTGVLHPVIVLPRKLVDQLSPEQRQIVVAHELIHVRRWDLAAGWAEVLLSAIWWFHPAMWWCKRSLRQSREDCCDDVLVASHLAQPERYGETLIQAAASQSPATSAAMPIEPLALGFANQEHPAGRRIRRLMDDSIFRTDRIRLSAACVALLVAMIVLPGIRQNDATQAQERPASTAIAKAAATTQLATGDKTPVSEMLEKITGKVVDEQGRPIKGTTVKTRVSSHTKRWEKSRVLADQDLETDDNGAFELEISGTAEPDQEITFVAEVSSKSGFEIRFSEHGLENSGKLLELEPFQLTRGMRIKGRVVAPDTGDTAPVGTVVSISANYQTADETNGHIYQYLKCDSEGFFAVVVPATCQLTLDASAKNYASNVVKHDLKTLELIEQDEIEERDFGEIKLSQGTSVFGVARYRDGRPAVGVVLGMIEGDNPGNPKDVSAAKTDSQGRFRFFPHSGKCMILALKQCRTRQSYGPLQGGLKSDGAFPLIGPHFLDLNGKGAELELNLFETETVILSGVIRNAEGNPVPNVTVQCGWHTDRGLVEVEYASTDEQGQYSSRVPKGSVPSLQIRDQSVFGEWYEPFLADPNSNSSNDLFTNPSVKLNEKLKFKPAVKSVSDLDWVMTKYQHHPGILKRVRNFANWWFLGE